MKKFILIFLFIPFLGYSQSLDKLIIRNKLTLNNQLELKDSIVNSVYSGTLVNTNYVNNTIGDSLDSYADTTWVNTAITHSLDTINVVSLGTSGQIPFVNPTGTDLAYSDNLKYNGKTFILSDGNSNILIGLQTGENVSTGLQNTFIGAGSGGNITDGNYNTFIGRASGFQNINGTGNCFIGRNAGYGSSGDSSIFIGLNAGYNETGSNKLYVENSNSATPLIWGDFANDTVRINGVLEVTENLSADTITTDYLNVKGVMQIAKAEILYTNQTQTTIITLPANAVIFDIGLNVITEFNDSGTALLDVGTTTAGSHWLNDLSIESSTFFIMFRHDQPAAHISTTLPEMLTSSTDITFTYDGQNNDATQGQAFIYIHYSLH